MHFRCFRKVKKCCVLRYFCYFRVFLGELFYLFQVLNSSCTSVIFPTSLFLLCIPLCCPYFIFLFQVFFYFRVKCVIFRSVIFSLSLYPPTPLSLSSPLLSSPYPSSSSYFIFGLRVARG